MTPVEDKPGGGSGSPFGNTFLTTDPQTRMHIAESASGTVNLRIGENSARPQPRNGYNLKSVRTSLQRLVSSLRARPLSSTVALGLPGALDG
jgi:hypothetical protein